VQNVKEQNMFHGQYNITRGTICKYRAAATIHTPETWFVSDISLQVPCIKVTRMMMMMIIIIIIIN
jgi:hypothetical protein